MDFIMDELKLGRNAIDFFQKEEEKNSKISSRLSGFSKKDLKILDIFITVFNEQQEENGIIDIQRLNELRSGGVEIQILNLLHREIVDTLGPIAEETKKGVTESVIEIDLKERNKDTSKRWERWKSCILDFEREERDDNATLRLRNWGRFDISELKTLEWILVDIECLVKNKSYYLLYNYLLAYKGELLSELKKREGKKNDTTNIGRFLEERWEDL